MNKDLLGRAKKWILNTNVDTDKIADFIGIDSSGKNALREIGKKIREKRDVKWEK